MITNWKKVVTLILGTVVLILAARVVVPIQIQAFKNKREHQSQPYSADKKISLIPFLEND